MPSHNLNSVQVGDLLPALSLPPLNRTTLALFAGASGDHMPLHIDTDFARRAGMADVFGHGMLSMAYLGRLLTNWAPQSQLRQFNARFNGITHLGNSITCSGKVVRMTEQDGNLLLTVELQARTQYGDVKTVGDAVFACPLESPSLTQAERT
jgi:acyl dehydratase